MFLSLPPSPSYTEVYKTVKSIEKVTELSSSCSGLVVHPPGTEVLVHTNAREALGLVGEREEEGDNLRGGGWKRAW